MERKEEGSSISPEKEIWILDWEEAALGQAGAKIQKLVEYECKDKNVHKMVLNLVMRLQWWRCGHTPLSHHKRGSPRPGDRETELWVGKTPQEIWAGVSASQVSICNR